MIVDAAHYVEGRRQDEQPLALAEAAERSRKDGFVWINVHDPAPDELQDIAEYFNLPELAVEDAMQAHQRPKIEDYDDGFFLVVHSAHYVDEREEVEFGEVHIFMGPRYVIVVRHGAGGDLHEAHDHLQHHPDLLPEGPNAAVWAVLDKIVDDYGPVVAGLENDVEEVEVAVFDSAGDDQSRRIYFLRRELAEFYRATHPLLSAFDALESSGRTGVSAVLREHLRDVEDHLKHIDEEVVTLRELLTSILQASLSVIAVQQNDVVRKISGWAAVIAVPTLIASIYGMNFRHMPELTWRYGYAYGLALMLGVGFALHRLLRRAGWL